MEDLAGARAAAQAVAAAVRRRRESEAQLIESMCELAACYRLGAGDVVEALCEGRVRVGAVGTPRVSEFVCLELAGLLGCSALSAGCRLAEALNLKFRHPALYRAVLACEVDAWVALKAATKCASLTPELAERVTGQWMRERGGPGAGPGFTALERLIVAADPVAAAGRESKAREERSVRVWGLEDGVMQLTGRMDVLDARFLDSRLDEVARLIGERFPELTHEQRRAKALGVLANPAYATALLQEAALQQGLFQEPGVPAPVADPGEDVVVRNHEFPRRLRVSACRCEECVRLGPFGPVPARPPHREVDGVEGPSHCGAGGQRFDPHEVLGHHCGVLRVPAGKLRPRLGIAVHLHADAFGRLTGDARVERAGHITAGLLAELLGEGVEVHVHPVIDLPGMHAEDQHRPSARMRRAAGLVFPVEPFPYSARPSQGLDLDHTVAFRETERGQTRVGNLAPLSRRVHRVKTAGHWRVEQPSPGVLRWRSPLGFEYTVTPHGTRAGPAPPGPA